MSIDRNTLRRLKEYARLLDAMERGSEVDAKILSRPRIFRQYGMKATTYADRAMGENEAYSNALDKFYKAFPEIKPKKRS